VSRGVLNLAHRNGHTQPEPLVAGTPTEVELELEATSWVFEPGHRLRLALAGSDWPNTWPPPHAGALDVERSTVALELPVLDGRPVAPPPEFHQPPPVKASDDVDAEPPPVVRRIERDTVGHQTRVVTAYGYRYAGPYDAFIEESYEGLVGVSEDDPGQAWATARTRYAIEWPEVSVSTEAHLRFRSTASTYHVVVEVIGTDGIGRVERRFERTIPRRLQ
jgi:hypothetical protein